MGHCLLLFGVLWNLFFTNYQISLIFLGILTKDIFLIVLESNYLLVDKICFEGFKKFITQGDQSPQFLVDVYRVDHS